MSNRTHLQRARGIGIALALGLAFSGIPAATQAAPVDLATASPFVVLAGTTVTNSGPSVLNGDLGVSPGSALVGFEFPATVNGATHATTAVAGQAQSDITTAYNVAAGEPVAPADDLTGTNLGNRTLTAGAYEYTSDAFLTGPIPLVLDGEGDPNAQFVFQITSELITSPGSSVQMIGEASPCNVYWQVGSSATLDTTTAFQGNVMALTDISLLNGASVIGRLFARNGQISLLNNFLDNSQCDTDSTTTPPPSGTTPPGASTTPGTTPSTGTSRTRRPGNGGLTGGPTRNGRAVLRPVPRPNGPGRPNVPNSGCTEGFRATVRGHLIKRAVFSLDGARISSQSKSPFRVNVQATPGARHYVRAHVTFKDATRAKTLTLRYRACAAAVLRPPRGPSVFTG